MAKLSDAIDVKGLAESLELNEIINKYIYTSMMKDDIDAENELAKQMLSYKLRYDKDVVPIEVVEEHKPSGKVLRELRVLEGDYEVAIKESARKTTKYSKFRKDLEELYDRLTMESSQNPDDESLAAAARTAEYIIRLWDDAIEYSVSERVSVSVSNEVNRGETEASTTVTRRTA